MRAFNYTPGTNHIQTLSDYIYTGTLQNIQDQDELKELLELSDAWEMKELFSIIENELITTITLDTCREGGIDCVSFVDLC